MGENRYDNSFFLIVGSDLSHVYIRVTDTAISSYKSDVLCSLQQIPRKESDGVSDLLNRFGCSAAFWKAYAMPFR